MNDKAEIRLKQDQIKKTRTALYKAMKWHPSYTEEYMALIVMLQMADEGQEESLEILP